MSLIEWISGVGSVVVSIAALVVSLISLRATARFNDRQNEFAANADRLNQLLIDQAAAEGMAAKKADLSANLYEAGIRKYRLKVFNRGKGTARNVRLMDLADRERSILVRGDMDEKFPVPVLEQHQSVEVLVGIHLGSPSRAHIKLVWDDDCGQDHEKELTPSL